MSRTALNHTPGLLALLLLATTPALAQDDPFEAIVSNPDGANVKLNDVSLPARNPTKDEIRQYLEAFRVINLNASFTADNGKRKQNGQTDVYVPVGNATVGPFEVKSGSRVGVKVGFEKRPGEREAVMRTLELNPANPMRMGPLRFNKAYMDAQGVIHMKLNLSVMGVDFWPQELTIEKIYKDRGGNLVFKTGGSGLAGKAVPDMRITKDGRVQVYRRWWWILGPKKWRDVKVEGEVVKLDSTLPINRWPPRATDLMEWLPKPGTEGTKTDPSLDALQPVLEAIPVKDLDVDFVARGGVSDEIKLKDGSGELLLSNHTLRGGVHGSFQGRTFKIDGDRSGYSATGTLTGKIDKPGLGKVTIERVDMNVKGDLKGEVPFEDGEKTNIETNVEAHAAARLKDIDAGLEGQPRLKTDAATGSFDGKAKLVLRPLTGDPDDKKELSIDRDSNYRLRVKGPVTLSNLNAAAPKGTQLPESLTLEATDDPSTPDVDERKGPVLAVDGKLGTKMGFVFAKTDVALHGETTKGGAISALTGEGPSTSEFFTTLRPGAKVHVKAYAFAGMKEKTLKGGGVRLTADARIDGTGEGTSLKGSGLEADLPGATKVGLRVATNVRHGTKNGAETIVRSAAAKVTAELQEGEGTIKMDDGLPGSPKLSATVAPGTKLEAETGLMRRSDVHGTPLETQGYEDGQKTARFKAHLVLTAGSVAMKDMALGFQGRTTADLELALGLKFDPKALMTGQPGVTPKRALNDPIPVDLDLTIGFAAGSRLSLTQPGTDASAALSGNTNVTLHGSLVVDPTTGKPTMQALNGIDVTLEADSIDAKTLLGPAGGKITAHVGSRTTVSLKNVRVEFLEKGLRLLHDGIKIELAAGAIDIGTGQ